MTVGITTTSTWNLPLFWSRLARLGTSVVLVPAAGRAALNQIGVCAVPAFRELPAAAENQPAIRFVDAIELAKVFRCVSASLYDQLYLS